jgi:alpha-tubulin suppressor-like RCC1 family protein
VTEIAHTVVWTSRGAVYTFGWSFCGQLGQGAQENVLVPRRVGAALLRVVSASAGINFTAVVTTEGQLWAFDSNKYGQLGQGGADDHEGRRETAPVRIWPWSAESPHERVARVAAGNSHLLALTESGKLYSVGSNSYGELGRGAVGAHTGVSGLVQHEALEQAVGVEAGGGRSAVVLGGGRMLHFDTGSGGDGRLLPAIQ